MRRPGVNPDGRMKQDACMVLLSLQARDAALQQRAETVEDLLYDLFAPLPGTTPSMLPRHLVAKYALSSEPEAPLSRGASLTARSTRGLSRNWHRFCPR